MGKNKKSDLGQVLNRNRKKQGPNSDVKSFAGKHVAVADGGDATHALTSYLDGSSLDDFLHQAVLSGRQFVAEKENAVVLEGNGMPVLTEHDKGIVPEMEFTEMKVPRRPTWDENTTAVELNEREKDAFLEWRRDLSVIELNSEKRSVTPFEKNLEVWRQLWRVVERSDVVIQIVDSRNPLFYRSGDLEKYCKELSVNKQTLLIVNKADFLSEDQRSIWLAYFKEQGIKLVFFSAKLEQEKLDEAARVERLLEEEMESRLELASLNLLNESDQDDSDEDSEEEDDEEEKTEAVRIPTEMDVFTREELLDFLNALSLEIVTNQTQSSTETTDRVIFGMVGFPNVGKSSVINALLGACANTHTKRVAVGATPGKTKHFQTLHLSEQVTLCDCPGLVFPSFVNSSSEMICAGVLSLAQLRAHIEPSLLVCRRIPKAVLDATYGITIPTLKAALPTDPVDPYVFLETYARSRGFMTSGKGMPDASRAARVVLKDYVTGKLLYCHPPPTLSTKHPAFDPHQLMIVNCLPPPPAVPLSEEAKAALENELPLDTLEDAETKKTVVSRRLKRHGRKGRKGRDPTPYDDTDMLGDAARFTAKISARKKKASKSFVRITMPHHASYTSISKATSENE